MIELPALTQCIKQTPWRNLAGIMAKHALPILRGERKNSVINTLAAHLSTPQTLEAIIPQLDGNAQAALRALVQASGAALCYTFERGHGATRTYRPWDKDEKAAAPPWVAPISATETLRWWGLIYRHPRKAAPGQPQYWVLPAELYAQVADLLRPSHADAGGQLRPRPGQPADLAWHLAVWLATIAGETIRPLHGRWLPPKLVAALATRTGLDRDPHFVLRRSERRIPYLAFLHYLAAVGEFVVGEFVADTLVAGKPQAQRAADGPPHPVGASPTPEPRLLTLTPGAWQWLACPTHDRWQQLWTAWCAAPADLATPYRFAWEPISPNARDLILAALPNVPRDQWQPLAEIVAQIRLLDRWGFLPSPRPRDWYDEDSTYDPVAEYLLGPLFWLGVIDLADATPDIAGVHPCQMRLSRHGAWLLGLPNATAPTVPAPQACTIRRGAPDLIQVPIHVVPAHLARITRYGTWAIANADAETVDAETVARPGGMAHALRLEPARFAQAAAHGVAETELFQDIALALGRGLSRREQQRWRSWLTAGQTVAIRPYLVLETRNAELMATLRKRKLVRRRLGAILGPARNEVNPQDVPALVQTLQTLGYAVAAPPAATPKLLDAAPAAMDLSPALQYMLLQLYRGLSDVADLPVKIDWALQDQIYKRLSLLEVAAAEETAQQLLDQVRAGLRGYLRVPYWSMTPVEAEQSHRQIMNLLQTALADEARVQLCYQAPGYDEPITRQVTPYWIEERHDLDYLIAYCHRRNAERVFRVDRIVHCALVTG